MKKLIVVAAAIVLVANGFAHAEDEFFSKVKLADAKGKQADATLVFSDSTKSLVIRMADRDLVSVPYGNLDKFSYEYTKKHRITSGAVVMVFSLGAGAVVMLTKSKSNWLYIDYRDHNIPKSVVLKLGKKDVRPIFAAVKTHTGKEVIDLGNAGKG